MSQRKIFNFEANIIKRRKISKSSLFFGLVAAALLGYTGLTYLEYGAVPILEEFIQQLGFSAYMPWVYLGVFVLLLSLVIPALYTVFRKKVVRGGKVSFDEANLNIVKGRDKYVIPEAQLNHLDFEIKALPSGKATKEGQLFGGSWLKIPTKNGTFECEIEIDTPQKQEQLKDMIEFLKIEHDVEVKIKESK